MGKALVIFFLLFFQILALANQNNPCNKALTEISYQAKDVIWNSIMLAKEREVLEHIEREYKTRNALHPEYSRVYENWQSPEVRPFVLDHGAKTDYSVLLVHGLGSSPYYIRQYADFLYSLGFNVVGITLSGHGYDRQALKNSRVANVTNWKRDVTLGFKMASALGENVIGLGFSTGASLLLDLSAPDQVLLLSEMTAVYETSLKFSGLILLNPALEIANPIVAQRSPEFFKALSFVRPYIEYGDADANFPFMYSRFATQAVGQLQQIIKNVSSNPFWASAPNEILPLIFTTVSEADEVVNSQKTIDFLSKNNLATAKDILVFSRQEGLAHSAITRVQTSANQPFMTDQQFERIKFRIQQFITRVRHRDLTSN